MPNAYASFMPVYSQYPVWRTVSTTSHKTCTIDQYDDAYCFGYNEEGKLGVGSSSRGYVTTPVRVIAPALPSGGPEFGGWATISTGKDVTCAIAKGTRAAYCWVGGQAWCAPRIWADK